MRCSTSLLSALSLLVSTGTPVEAGEGEAAVTAECRFAPANDGKNSVPERYRLPAQTFEYRLTPGLNCGTAASPCTT